MSERKFVVDEYIVITNGDKKIFKNIWAFKRYMRKYRLARLSGTLRLKFSVLNGSEI